MEKATAEGLFKEIKLSFHISKKKLFTITACWTFVLFILASFILLQLKIYNTDVIDKSPVLPYKSYDYMTTEVTEYKIDDKSDFVPAFFRTDFASIPQYLWFFDAPYKSEFVYASIWHDYRYSCPNGMQRKDIDDIFYSLLISEKAGTFKAAKMYLAVRLFGESHFYDGDCSEIVYKEIQDDEIYYNEETNDGRKI